ncbi:N-acetylmuramoyl-L-alanine amidase [Parageobacillus thermoglucosidasius]|nr:N-acetylmuramoyl-L-alanine amidase [Parageobacillus thermoglucosidasius]MED4905219.1 N-acetylmuramoyl-L-alanine amidase [Parageobacillus thermoglucosidasius]MED4914290.1 N-acetylmuramoyl-L-alanine amidase [Parageobacillus thermoglucosidasius]MED4945662.1 N-acetylmuramoyl-L-alanine amidase [Parageobacillus thermoglucosidasius]MED4981501.1 N-acetylmuramoyl-L-alanine amidase [Parageobacillus thermoglucosidasius]RDE29434.1 N-acetylmuramoyl-L-alanine amidase [Parageobacillus thermoglucosidasius]
MVKIFIDPGHGGADPGAIGNGLQEKNVTLQIAVRVRDILLAEYDNVSIRMSRIGDQTVSLTERTAAANTWGADFYLSIHVNSGGGTGYEDYVYPGVGSPTTTYQKNIHEEIIKLVDFLDRGMKQANFFVLRETNMPAVLTENGFIDNANDAAKLKSSSFIENIARGHVNGIVRSFGLPKKSAGTLYKVQIGAFRVKTNADHLAAKAKAKGFNVYVIYKDGLYKVQIGAFANLENAKQLAEKAKAAGFEAIIIQE